MIGVISNVVLGDVSQSALCIALLTGTVASYAGSRNSVKRWYYGRSISRHNYVRKSYTVTWRIIDAIAGAIALMATLALTYIVVGLLADDWPIYGITPSQFRFYTISPVVIFWAFAVGAWTIIALCAWCTKPDNDIRENEKLSAFEADLAPTSEMREERFSPGDRSPTQGSYYAIDNRTKIPRGQIFMRGGDSFPKIGDHDIYYIRRGG